MPAELTILGGGPAGLAVGYYCRRRGLPFTIYEAADRPGGNAVTFEHNGFRFDSGAHRFHARDPEITADVRELLDGELRRVEMPSRIFYRGRYVDFPLSPLDLVAKLGLWGTAAAGLSLAAGRMRGRGRSGSFEDAATYRYGRVVARRFLLNYSAKLWGLPAAQLAAEIASYRLRGLDLRTLLKEALQGRRAKVEHLDGSFYYPEKGYGSIVERLAAACGPANLRTGSRIRRILHDGRAVRSVEVDGARPVGVSEVVSTLPLPLTARILDPAPPPAVLEAARGLRFRALVLVVLFVDAERITDAGTVYFPSPEIPFTRVSEPKNRSPSMSPQGRTSLCAELPCDRDDATWRQDDSELAGAVIRRLERIGWIRRRQVFDWTVVRLPSAYPVLDLGFRARVETIASGLSRLANLRLLGRNALFQHSSVHHMLRLARDAVDDYARAAG